MAGSRVVMFDVVDNRLTSGQSAHVSEIGREFCHLVADKYARGQQEHGGNLWDLTEDVLLDQAIDEAVDQVTYLLTIRRKRRDANRINRL